MTREIGNERVLAALAETLPGVGSVDLERGAAAASAAAASRYTERGELGRGGLAVVVEAFDEDLRRSVALKRPHLERLNEHGVAAMVREAQITAQLEHPNIPSVHTLGIDAVGRPFFTMTLLRGRSLAELLVARAGDPALRQELSTARLLRVLQQVCYAVAFAHSRGVLHRDLKPPNIIIGEFGEVRLMDWGLAKVVGKAEPAAPAGDAPAAEHPSLSSGGAFIGTPGYAPPEQVRGELDLDGRSDVYALGALAYTMLAGRPPIAGRTIEEVVLHTVEGEIAPLRSLVPVSRPLAAIVHKALATRREDRYQTVRALIDDLERLQEGRRVAALAEGKVTRIGRWYAGRSPRLGRLRNIDVDFLSGGSFFGGLCLGVYLLKYWPVVGEVLASVLGTLGLVMSVVPVYTLLRRDRPDDPGVVHAFNDSLLMSGSARRDAARRGDGGGKQETL